VFGRLKSQGHEGGKLDREAFTKGAQALTKVEGFDWRKGKRSCESSEGKSEGGSHGPEKPRWDSGTASGDVKKKLGYNETYRGKA